MNMDKRYHLLVVMIIRVSYHIVIKILCVGKLWVITQGLVCTEHTGLM